MSQPKRQFFGTDGVRGPYGGPLINELFAARLGLAVARFFARNQGGADWVRGAQPWARALIGRDTRASGESLQGALAAGMAAGGMEVVALGVVPTPAVAGLLMRTRAVLGAMITASHNPAADNGIKFFDSAGLKLTDAEELEVERLLPSEDEARTVLAEHTGALSPAQEGEGISVYLDKVRAVLPAGSLAGWCIVLDTANGATCATSPEVLRSLGAVVDAIAQEPDGRNINAGVGSEYPDKLAARVRETGACVGIAHDGDGDRCVLCDETGGVLDGDEILTMLALHALKHRRLAADILVVTIQSNMGVDAAVRAAGGKVARSAVGDRYVVEKMQATGATLGGESSGHIIFYELSHSGDGLVAALKVLELMLATGKPLSELRRVLCKFPQVIKNLKVREKRELALLPRLTGEIAALERELAGAGRVLVRYSGTEAKLRLLIEGPTDAVVKAGAERLEAAARADLDVL